MASVDENKSNLVQGFLYNTIDKIFNIDFLYHFSYYYWVDQEYFFNFEKRAFFIWETL